MTFPELEIFLRNNHFYPITSEVTVGTKGRKVTALQVQANPNDQDRKLTRLNEVLDGTGYLGQRLNNVDYLVITKIK